MKIGLVSPYDWNYPGGVRDHIRHLAEQFIRKGTKFVFSHLSQENRAGYQSSIFIRWVGQLLFLLTGRLHVLHVTLLFQRVLVLSYNRNASIYSMCMNR